MVSIGNGEAKPLRKVMTEIAQCSKLMHRVYFRSTDSDHYTALMAAHDQLGNLCIVMGLVAMPAIKEIVPIDVFERDFSELKEHTAPPKAERSNVDSVT